MKSDKNCMSFWFPRIEAAGLPVPRTTLIDAGEDWHEAGEILDGRMTDTFQRIVDSIAVASGDYDVPFFLRTGHTSGKHQWSDTCFVTDRDLIASHVSALIEVSSLASIMGLPFRVWAVRQMLPVVSLFRCETYDGMPVNREIRVFVDGGRVLYHVPYWPEDAAMQGDPDQPGWRRKLKKASRIAVDEYHAIEALASRSGAACGGLWSVDVIETSYGWYVTDMAEADRSFGWDESKINSGAT